jgi:hypothetical protein
MLTDGGDILFILSDDDVIAKDNLTRGIRA